MLNTNIVVVCTTGKNRSRYLKEYLETKGILAHAVGVNSKNADVKRKINNAKVVVSVHPDIEEVLEERYTLEHQKLIKLEVDDHPSTDAVPTKRITGEKWVEFQKEYVYPELERQIKKHLSVLA